MPAGGLEPPKPTEGQQIYSLSQLPLCDTGAKQDSIVKDRGFPPLPGIFLALFALCDFRERDPLPLVYWLPKSTNRVPLAATPLGMVFGQIDHERSAL
jgi:hypothetical protein